MLNNEEDTSDKYGSGDQYALVDRPRVSRNPDELLQHLLNDLLQLPNIARKEMSEKVIDIGVLFANCTKFSSYRSTERSHFLQYVIVFLHNNYPTDEISFLK